MATSKELTRIQGCWKGSRITSNGSSSKAVATFKGDRVEISVEDVGDFAGRILETFDRTGGVQVLDVEFEEMGISLGLARIEGHDLEWCANAPGLPHPTNTTEPAKKGQRFVLRKSAANGENNGPNNGKKSSSSSSNSRSDILDDNKELDREIALLGVDVSEGNKRDTSMTTKKATENHKRKDENNEGGGDDMMQVLWKQLNEERDARVRLEQLLQQSHVREDKIMVELTEAKEQINDLHKEIKRLELEIANGVKRESILTETLQLTETALDESRLSLQKYQEKGKSKK